MPIRGLRSKCFTKSCLLDLIYEGVWHLSAQCLPTLSQMDGLEKDQNWPIHSFLCFIFFPPQATMRMTGAHTAFILPSHGRLHNKSGTMIWKPSPLPQRRDETTWNLFSPAPIQRALWSILSLRSENMWRAGRVSSALIFNGDALNGTTKRKPGGDKPEGEIKRRQERP